MKYIVIVEETKDTLGGKPRIAGTRLGLDLLYQWGLKKFKKMYPCEFGWWTDSIMKSLNKKGDDK
jgi:hypothetical protein